MNGRILGRSSWRSSPSNFGFDGTEAYISGIILSSGRVDPYSIITEFHVLDVHSPHNAILGRPWLHLMSRTIILPLDAPVSHSRRTYRDQERPEYLSSMHHGGSEDVRLDLEGIKTSRISGGFRFQEAEAGRWSIAITYWGGVSYCRWLLDQGGRG